jgi:hypothetical protein
MRVLPIGLLLLSLCAAWPAAATPVRPAPAAAPVQDKDQKDWDLLESSSAPLQQRIDTARILAARARKGGEPAKTAERLDALGAKFSTDAQLRGVLSECVAQCDSPETQKLLARLIGTGQPFEKRFRLRAARGCAPGPVDEAALRLLTDKDEGVRAEALALVVAHKHTPAVKSLEALLKAGRDEALLGPSVAAISELLEGSAEWDAWQAQLLELGRASNDGVRRAALSVLARDEDAARLPLFLDVLRHPDWSSRAIALAWLARSQSKEAVSAIIERFQAEAPGSRLAADCGDTLRRMTGQPLPDDPQAWATWWSNVRATFEFPRASGPRTGGAKRPPPQSGTKAPEFYGIEIQSQRVVFVIDVSGSMTTEVAGAKDRGLPRIEVAKRELANIVDALPPGSLFNIIAFNDTLTPWLPGVDASAEVATGGLGGQRKGPSTGQPAGPRKDERKDDKARARDAEKQKKADELLRGKAKDFVTRLAAQSGTNIYDALELAFQDPSVDTIFFLSDGIPSTGAETDPAAIREAVRRWNESRRLKINCVAVGTELPLLKWLAQDSGGEYKFFP